MNDSEFYREFITRIGDDPDRRGLERTPQRIKESYDFLTSGYTVDVAEELNNAIFEEDYDEMVLVKNIYFFSLC